jgi:ankyrin repeat protein
MWDLIKRNDQKQLEKYLSSIKKKKTLTALLCSRNEIGNTPLLEAISQGREKILGILLDYAGGISINVQDIESGYSPLHKVW